ncbi:hypothetical protein [Fusobacterium sp. SYSU M8A802]
MSLHYNADGSILATMNIKGNKITVTFHTKQDLDNFFKLFN